MLETQLQTSRARGVTCTRHQGQQETRPRRASQNPQALGWGEAGCRAGKMLSWDNVRPGQRPHWNLSKPDLLLSPQKCTHQPPLTTTTRPSVSSGPNSGIVLDSPFFNTFLKMHSESHPSYPSAGLGPMATNGHHSLKPGLSLGPSAGPPPWPWQPSPPYSQRGALRMQVTQPSSAQSLPWSPSLKSKIQMLPWAHRP